MDIAIIGAGPAGLMCAIKAGENRNNNITLIDSNEKVGKKLFITGKGRCNVCNFCSASEFLNNVVTNSKFLFGAINKFSPQDTYNFFESSNIKLKVERGQRVFPTSDKSSDIIKGLLNRINKNNTKILLSTKVLSVSKNEDRFFIKTSKEQLSCDCLVIATGGKSYSSTGSTGDGYKFAKNLGHEIITPKPALVPIKLKNYDGSLAGLALKNVKAKIEINGKCFEQFGELLFTHEGISGPIILTLSSFINRYNVEDKKLFIDLKPTLTEKTLDDRLLRDFSIYKNKTIKNYFKELLPNSLISYFIKAGNFDEDKKINLITKEERRHIIFLLKNFSFNIKCLDNIDFGIITSGGVDVKQVNPKNMESKLCPNLFFAGEVLDLDALTGGFNIQIALSTGYCVGDFLKEKEKN